jgi:hypothetical protein
VEDNNYNNNLYQSPILFDPTEVQVFLPLASLYWIGSEISRWQKDEMDLIFVLKHQLQN